MLLSCSMASCALSLHDLIYNGQIKGVSLVSVTSRIELSLSVKQAIVRRHHHKRDSKKKTKSNIYGAFLKGKNAGVRSAMPKHLDEKNPFTKPGQIKNPLPPSIILFSTGTEHWRPKPKHLIREARRWCCDDVSKYDHQWNRSSLLMTWAAGKSSRTNCEVSVSSSARCFTTHWWCRRTLTRTNTAKVTREPFKAKKWNILQ